MTIAAQAKQTLPGSLTQEQQIHCAIRDVLIRNEGQRLTQELMQGIHVSIETQILAIISRNGENHGAQ